MLTDANECGMNILYKYDIADEFREVALLIDTPEFVYVMEYGTHEEIVEHVGEMISPLT